MSEFTPESIIQILSGTLIFILKHLENRIVKLETAIENIKKNLDRLDKENDEE